MTTEGDKPTSGQASIAFFNLPGMYAQVASVAFHAIQELHNQLKSAGFPDGTLIMSAFTGAIVVVRDGVFANAKDKDHHSIHSYFKGL